MGTAAVTLEPEVVVGKKVTAESREPVRVEEEAPDELGQLETTKSSSGTGGRQDRSLRL